MIALALALALVTPNFAAPPDTALLSYESGVLVAADWIQWRGTHLRSYAVIAQSAIRDVTIDLTGDGTAVHSAARVGNAGEPLGAPVERDAGAGQICWSDQVTSSLELAILRARAIGHPHVTIPGASLYRNGTTDIDVERIDAVDWVVSVNHKRYEVQSDWQGHLLTALLPDFGVTIERRTDFPLARYPLWPANAAAPGANYVAQEVRIAAPQGHVLAGTLTVPGGAGPLPAAVLITGLSANVRNNGTPPWMPLRDIADALTRRGIAVLRVDDRGVGQSSGDRASSTTFDEAEDVRTEIAWLRKRRGIDGRRIALVGYSEGGLIAPMVAAVDSALAGIVTLAGTGVPGPEVARYQIQAAVVRDTSIPVGAREDEIAKQLADSLTAREKSFLSIDPLAYARRVRCPALILHGATDLHVPPRSAQRLASAMREGGNRDVIVRIFPGVSHAFLPDPCGASSGWAGLPGFMTSPEVLETIAEWASRRLAARAPRTGRSPGTSSRSAAGQQDRHR